MRHSFEEYKLYYDSTEKVTDRRLETNRWNYSICVSIVVAIAAMTNWSLSHPALAFAGILADLLLCILAILFCALWIGQIQDFKNLNNAKFSLLNEMAPSVDFDIGHPGAVVSFCPFEKEWKKLEELDALQKLGYSKIIVLKSTKREYFIPGAFIFTYLSILGLLLFIVVNHWSLSLTQHSFKMFPTFP